MKKILITVLFIKMLMPVAYGQVKIADYLFTEQSIGDEILTFKPVQRDGVSNQKFNYAQRILEDTKSAVKGNPQNSERGRLLEYNNGIGYS